MRGTNISFTESILFETAFDADGFLNLAKGFWPALDNNDRWIRSGVHIGEAFKDYFSSYRLIASYVPAGARNRFEVLLLRPQPGMDVKTLEPHAIKMMEAYMSENGIEAVLAALPSGSNETWKYYFFSRAKNSVPIPADILRHLSTQALKNFLRVKCPALSCAALEGYFSAFNFLYDDLPLQQNAHEIDKALTTLKVCDISANDVQILAAMAEEVAAMRDHLSKYVAPRSPRTHAEFIKEFWTKSAYATDLDTGALELLKLKIRATLPEGAELDDSHFVFGSVLHEKLFDETFDVVLSNPPHVRQEEFSQIKETLTSYAAYHKGADLYCYYVERAFSLLAQKGVLALLTSNRWLRSDYGAPLRSFLAEKNVTDLVDYGNIPTLLGIVTPMSVLIATNEAPTESFRVTLVTERPEEGLSEFAEENAFPFARARLDEKAWSFHESSLQAVMKKIEENAVRLENFVAGGIYRGILTGLNEAFVLQEKEAMEIKQQDRASGELLRPFLSGRNVKRYETPKVKKYLILIPRGFTNRNRGEREAWEWFSASYPAVARHLANYKAKAERRKDQGDYWWELRSCKYYNAFERTKIISPSIVNRISATMDARGLFSNDRTSIICSDDWYLLGLLNARLLDFYARRITTELLNGYFEMKPANLANLPIRKISETNGFQRKLRDEISERARTLSEIYAKTKAERNEEDDARAIETERALNRAVYKLYKLSPQEISIVENN